MIEKARLPVIDLSEFVGGTVICRQKIADAVVHACETSGFFYISGHGIPAILFEEARQVALEFFHGSAKAKSRVHISTVPHHRGYIGNYDVAPDTDKGGDMREAFKVGLELGTADPDYRAGITLYGPNVWPQGMPRFHEKIYRIYKNFMGLSDSIFSLFAVGLNLPDDHFVPLTRKPASIMNVNYYPPTRDEPGTELSGIGAHSDYEAFAMLWQDDVGGLQIESPEGEWQAVEPLNNTLVINIGDLMSRWTNDRFRATRHRVINSKGKERVSFACFGNTNYHALIECIPSCLDENNPPKYAPITSGDYLMKAIKRTYAYT